MPDAHDFGDVERTFETQQGERVSKVRTKFGGSLFYSESRGQINQQQYSSLSSQRPEVQMERGIQAGRLEREDIDIDRLSKQYQSEQTFPIGDLEPGSIEREELKQSNMFIGYLLDDETPDNRLDAIREYEEMTQRIRNADSDSEIEDIKGDYNIGGTP